jgi:hypothetical protein
MSVFRGDLGGLLNDIVVCAAREGLPVDSLVSAATSAQFDFQKKNVFPYPEDFSRSALYLLAVQRYESELHDVKLEAMRREYVRLKRGKK